MTGYANNAEWIVPILDKYEFNIVPILNPDGYEYTYNVGGVSPNLINLNTVYCLQLLLQNKIAVATHTSILPKS